MGIKDKLLVITGHRRRLFRNRGFVLLWTGQSASVFGDAFFNLALALVAQKNPHLRAARI